VLESVFPWCGLGAYTMLDDTQPVPGIFLHPQEREREALVIHLLSNRSKVAVYRGSHLCRSLDPTAGDTLLEISTDQLPMKATEVVFEEGGL